MDIKEILVTAISKSGLAKDKIEQALQAQSDSKMGDFTLPCFRFSKELKKAPNAIADELCLSLKSDKTLSGAIEKIESVNGYLNFFVSRTDAAKQVVKEFSVMGENFDGLDKNGKTICIDYSSINIAKPFHIGHLMSTAIGGSLYRIYKFLGYDVVGINHLGDWGTQFGKLIVAYKMWGNDEDIKNRNIHALLDLYVKFHDEAEKNPDLNETARGWFKKIEDGDSEALQIFNYFKEVTLTEVNKIYDRLGIKFDSYNGESFYNNMLSDVVNELENKKLLSSSEGAKIVNLEDYDMPPCLILKADGASLYATRDIAAAKYRKQTYNFDKCLYVVAYQQNLHFQQFFKVIDLMGYNWAKDLVHVAFGMVSLEGAGSLSTRKGNVVFLKDVLDTAVNKTIEIINAKNPDIENKEKIASDIGVGAVVFGALSSSRIKDMVFSYEKSLSFEGETSPYIQYTHARCCSILKKEDGGFAPNKKDLNTLDYTEFSDEASYEVVKLISNFNKTVLLAADKYEPSILARYLIDLAQAYNKFYLTNKVKGNKERLYLTYITKNVLKNGLNLLLINAPESM